MIVEMKVDSQQYHELLGNENKEMAKDGRKAPIKQKLKTICDTPGLNPARGGSNPNDAKNRAIQNVN